VGFATSRNEYPECGFAVMRIVRLGLVRPAMKLAIQR